MLLTVCVISLYFGALLAIGIVSWRRTRSYAQYNLAGRENNKWVTGISHQASSASGWLLMGLPGAAYVMGFGVVWSLLGWLTGSLVNWFVLAKRLRAASEHYDSDTIFDLFSKRVGDHRGLVTRVSALILVVVMTINSSAELLAIGKVITLGFGIGTTISILVGLAIVMTYTSLGGFLALSWSNLLQGAMMVFALVVVPLGAASEVIAKWRNGELGQIDVDPTYFTVTAGATGFWDVIAFTTLGLGIALMFPGLVHALPSIMSIRDPQDIRPAGLIANAWGVLSLLGAASIGIIGRFLVPNLDDPENVLMAVTDSGFPGAVYGAIAAAILAASLSSICAYLISASSAVGASLILGDRSPAVQANTVRVQRLVIVVISGISCILAFNGGLVFEIALFAAAGLAAAFTPLVIASLFSPQINVAGALSSMASGLVVVVVWHYTGLGATLMHESFAGVAVSAVALFLVSRLAGGPSPEVRQDFELFRTGLHRRDTVHTPVIKEAGA